MKLSEWLKKEYRSFPSPEKLAEREEKLIERVAETIHEVAGEEFSIHARGFEIYVVPPPWSKTIYSYEPDGWDLPCDLEWDEEGEEMLDLLMWDAYLDDLEAALDAGYFITVGEQLKEMYGGEG